MRRALWIVAGLATLAGVALYAWAGSVQIEPGEEAVVLRLGRYDRTLREGWGLYWPGVERILRERTTGRAIVIGRRPQSEEGTIEWLLTRDGALVQASARLEYSIDDLRAYRVDVNDADSLLRDVLRSSLRESFAQRPADVVLTAERSVIESDVERRIVEKLARYGTPARPSLGVRQLRAELRDVQLPEPVRDVFGDATSVRQEEQAQRAEAEAYRREAVVRASAEAQRLVADARTYHDAKILEAEGEAARFVALLAEYRKAPEVMRTRLQLETLESVLPRVQKIIARDPDRVRSSGVPATARSEPAQ